MKKEQIIRSDDIEAKATAHSKQFDSDYREQAYSDLYEGAEWVQSKLQQRIAELEAELKRKDEALVEIQDWQMNYVEIARTTKVYQIAEQALKQKD